MKKNGVILASKGLSTTEKKTMYREKTLLNPHRKGMHLERRSRVPVNVEIKSG